MYKNKVDPRKLSSLCFGNYGLDLVMPDDKRARNITVLYKGKQIECTALLVPNKSRVDNEELIDGFIVRGLDE